MSDLNVEEVVQGMLEAAKNAGEQIWKKVHKELEDEFKTLTQVAARVVFRKAAGSISEVNARFIMAQYYGAMRNYLYAVEGIANIAIESMINAALSILRDAIKVATGGWVVI